jgi:hypothetical protein
VHHNSCVARNANDWTAHFDAYVASNKLCTYQSLAHGPLNQSSCILQVLLLLPHRTPDLTSARPLVQSFCHHVISCCLTLLLLLLPAFATLLL